MKHSVSLKLFSIFILILLLLIPSSMIKSIIQEREALSQETMSEVGSKWANAQQVKGPILTIPITYELGDEGERWEQVRHLNILPTDLRLSGNVNPEKLKRGIYEVIVYRSDLDLSGSFLNEFEIDYKNLKEIQWDNAFLTIGLTDLRGIKENIFISWDGQQIKAQPGSRLKNLINSGVTIDLPDISHIENTGIEFNFHLNLQGSENLSFVPVGGTTNVTIHSNWTSPSFNGSFLPSDREINENGFTASWKVLQLNRNFPQSWIHEEDTQSLDNARFGVDLIMPLDDYQKTMRSSKYAVMTIGLTFLIFFLVEVLHHRRIHAFQYTLVGLSLCLFYILLISISEHSNFNVAYGISMSSVIIMITLYSFSLFKARKISILLAVVLTGLYSFLLVTLQLADYALLMGSIGLMVILGLTMYYTRNVNWYDISTSKNQAK